MKHIFIINPTAGKYDQTKEMRSHIEAALRAFEHDTYEIYITKYAQDALHYSRKLAMSGEELRFYACGGDGTLNEVLNGICDYPNCALGVIPIGTGNDFIRSFEEVEPQDFLHIASQIHGEEKIIDVLKIDDMYSLNLISSGLDSAIAKHMSKFKRLPLVHGQSAYNLSLVYSFFTSLYHRFSFAIDEEMYPEDDYIFAVAANGKCYGGGYMAAPLANLQDGAMDIVCVKKVKRSKVIKLVNIYKTGKHLEMDDLVIFKRAMKLQLHSHKPFIMNIDGEIRKMYHPTISLVPGKVRFIVPDASKKDL